MQMHPNMQKAIILVAVVVLNSLRRRMRAARGRFRPRSPRNPHGIHR
jgi:hypothetical protein